MSLGCLSLCWVSISGGRAPTSAHSYIPHASQPAHKMAHCKGRDAADSAFATRFGGVIGAVPVIQIEAVSNAQGILVVPQHVPYALSTDGQWQ